MWTYRNELEPRWSYEWAYDLGWIKPKVTEEASAAEEPKLELEQN